MTYDENLTLDQTHALHRLEAEWEMSPRWTGIVRPYSALEVIIRRGTFPVDASLGISTSKKLWDLLQEVQFLRALGAITGNQAVQMIAAGLKTIYMSGWQVAADGNLDGETYTDQSYYSALSGPAMVRRIMKALERAHNVYPEKDWLAPIVADCEAGFGGPVNSYNLARNMILAGAAGLHYEDQLSSEKRCGHMGGKVLVPTRAFIKHLHHARLAADVLGVPTVLIARTDADAASFITNDVDPRDVPFLDRDKRTDEGFYALTGNPIDRCVTRALAYAPYADMLWMETSKPDLGQAKAFADGVHEKFPGKMLAYNCSPSFNWKKKLDDATISTFQEKIAEMGYKYQFVTLAGFHSLNAGMFELAHGYASRGMSAYVDLQEKEFQMEKEFGYGAVKHQEFVGTGHFDAIRLAIDGSSEMAALSGSTEAEQFHEEKTKE